MELNIVVFGLSITSSWGNGHATTFRSLIKALNARGHHVSFFEKDVSWYAHNRDMPEPPFCETILYRSPDEVQRYEQTLGEADLIIIGSFVADAQEILHRVREVTPVCLAFYDIDTPVTLGKLARQDYEYLHPDMIPEFDLYLSFTGGPVLEKLESRWGAQRARPLYCSVDPELYFPETRTDPLPYTLGYLGTYSDDRQPTLQRLLIDSAQRMPKARFCVAGAQYPREINWPSNVKHVEHIPPREHRAFYNGQRFTLNVTRQDMIGAGYSPSVRLFEAGACAIPVMSDYWDGLEHFFSLGDEILVAQTTHEALDILNMDEDSRRRVGEAMYRRVLEEHTCDHRAMELEEYWREAARPPLPSTGATSFREPISGGRVASR
ncbi:CgeB family protein [Gilvimarinus sp. F26214L]|uniref:CgeB family protein n=1 Tax=Gilvimarinus sp. DZF01 TaxID=3461371 RepID=UPI0040456F10